MADNPRISINKLGEYLEANPSRRKKIVSDQKNPATFITTRYSKARDIAIDFFSNSYDPEIIISGIESIENQPLGSDFQINDNQKSIEYIEKLLDTELPDLSMFTVTKYNGDNPKIVLNALDISVNPDSIIRGTIRGKKVVGAIKLHISQSNSLNTESAKNVATVLHKFVEEYIAEVDENAELKLCMSIDVFSDIIECAPRSYFRRRNYIADACHEIIMWWNTL